MLVITIILCVNIIYLVPIEINELFSTCTDGPNAGILVSFFVYIHCTFKPCKKSCKENYSIHVSAK